jgi:hypothetical protein
MGAALKESTYLVTIVLELLSKMTAEVRFIVRTFGLANKRDSQTRITKVTRH